MLQKTVERKKNKIKFNNIFLYSANLKIISGGFLKFIRLNKKMVGYETVNTFNSLIMYNFIFCKIRAIKWPDISTIERV